MSQQPGRYIAARPPRLAEGWSFSQLTPPSRLFGANGLRTGPDGRIYVAQVVGSQISALDLGSGALEAISPKGGDIVAPDDVAFDPDGNLYATEVMDDRVSVRDRSGRTRVVRDDVPSANGITCHRGRLFVGECRIGGRIREFSLAGGAPRLLAENLPLPNAMEVGPDGKLYFPVIGANEIWRIDLEGGAPEVVAKDLGVPDAVKFDPQGHIVSTQVHSGEVLRIDPRTGSRSVLAKLDPGLDNLTFAGDRLFVSNFTGQITEILGGGETRTVLPGGLNWPLGLAVGSDGELYVADGTHFYLLTRGGSLRTLGMLFTPGYPGVLRGIVASGSGEFLVTTASGHVARYQPARQEHEVLAQGLEQPYGIARAANGTIAVAELGAGRVVSVHAGSIEVLASGLHRPCGVAFGSDGMCLVSESGAGRVVRVTGAGVETVVDGLRDPQGILELDGRLYIVDAGAKSLIAFDRASGVRCDIATDLPVGAPPGVTPKPLRGLPPFSGPQGPFAGIAVGPDRTLYVSADATGSVLALRHGDLH